MSHKLGNGTDSVLNGDKKKFIVGLYVIEETLETYYSTN